MNKLMKDLSELNRDEFMEMLIDLMRQYDKYIQNANDEDLYSTGWRPVCLPEFYDCEYQLIKEQRKGGAMI